SIPIDGGQRFRRSRPLLSVVGSVIRSGGGVCVKGGHLGGGFAHRLSFQREPVGVVDKAVEDGVGKGWVADRDVPGVDRELACDEGGGAAVAVVHDLEEVAAVLRREGGQAPIVENEELDAGEILEEPGMPAVAAGKRQSLEQPRHALVENRTAVAARLV